MAGCPDDSVFVSLVEERLGDAERTALEEHLDRCPACAALVAKLTPERVAAEATTPGGGSALSLEAGDRLGRYEIERLLGRGGTGVVYAALDPKLDRSVAIKSLTGSRISPAARAALLQREARALAKVAHPSVVPVYDVGIDGGMVYVVMELVRGDTLRAWIERCEPSAREIVEAYRQVADGLAAAHVAGIVHRDVKPTNLMRASDGSIRVLDFGFAAALGREEEAVVTGGNPDAVDADRGQIVGTLGYMAPEQWRGESDARSDQFSFCAALYRSLTGRPPFPTAGMPRGKPAPARGYGVSRRLDVAIRRGLAIDPQRRWPSMASLHAELGRATRSRRLLPWIAAAAAVAGGVALVAPASDRCEERASALRAAWDPSARATLAEAFETTTGAFGEQTFARIAPALDAYVERWDASFVAACRERASTPTDRSLACLGRLRSEFEAQLEALGSPRRTAVVRAVESVAGLEDPRRCRAGATVWDEAVDSDPDLRRDIATLRARLRAGEAAELLERAADLEKRTRESPAPVRARARLLIGEIRYEAGDKRGSIPDFEAAYFTAADIGSPQTRARAAAELVFIHAVDLDDGPEAARWAEHAQVALGEIPESREHRAVLENALGAAALRRAEHEVALEHFEAAAEAWKVLGSDLGRVRTVSARANAAHVRFALGDYEAANAAYEVAVSDVRETFGDTHPMLVVPLTNRAATLRELGRHDEGLRLLDEAIAVARATLGSEHPDLARALSNRCQALSNMKPVRADAAERSCEEALAIRERVLGPDHPDVALTLGALGVLYRRMGRYEDAVAVLERARVVYSTRRTDGSPGLGPVLFELGQAHAAQGDVDVGIKLLGEARTLWKETLGAEHPFTRRADNRLAQLRAATAPRREPGAR